MQFNESFDDEASCDLIANAFALRMDRCEWFTNGQPCGTTIRGQDISAHMRAVHRVNDATRLVCLWANCGEGLNQGCLVRHLQERHLEYRWPCPKCDATFTRRGVMNNHRTGCVGTSG